MQDQIVLERITCDPNVTAGKPVIRGTRLTVEYILSLRAHGASEEEILTEYKGLTQEDIQACYLFAGKALETTSFMPLMPRTMLMRFLVCWSVAGVGCWAAYL